MKGLLPLKLQTILTILLSLTLPAIAENKIEESTPIKIGVAFGLTGVAAPFGKGELNSVKLAAEEWNRRGGIRHRPIELTIEDTTSTNKGTLTAIQKLVNLDKLLYVLGPTWLDSFGAALPVAERSGAILITASGVPSVYKSSSSEYQNTFSTWFNLDKEIGFLLNFAKKNHLRRIAVAFDNDPFFQAIDKKVTDQVSALDIEIVSRESFSVGDTDFRSYLTRLNEFQPQAIVFGFGDEGSLLAFLKQRKELCPDIKLLGTDYLDGYATLRTFHGLFEHTYYVSPQARDEEFRKLYERSYGESPVLSANTAYDAANILFRSIQEAGLEPELIKKYLNSHSFKTVTYGDMSFDNYGGVSTSQFLMKKVTGNKVQSITE